jgi:hypothetical protein
VNKADVGDAGVVGFLGDNKVKAGLAQTLPDESLEQARAKVQDNNEREVVAGIERCFSVTLVCCVYCPIHGCCLGLIYHYLFLTRNRVKRVLAMELP